MTFSAQDVAKLRGQTGAGIMECKNALKEANGNFERAGEILRQKGLTAASKKAEKTALEGIVTSKIAADKKSGLIIEINTQTDFTARNDLFLDLTRTVTDITLNSKPKNLDELLKLKTNNSTVSEFISDKIAKIGENIQIRRFELFELKDTSGIIGTYIHPVGYKIGVLVKLITSSLKPDCIEELEKLAKDISMHIAASQPQPEYIDKSEIPNEIIESERRIELGKEDLAKKPQDIAQKIVQGRLDKILSQRCLLDQPYIKDQSITIEKFIINKSKELNIEIKVGQFVRYNVGETIEKTSLEENKQKVISK